MFWKLAHSEGEIVFDRFCDLGFHRFPLLNGPGALGAREECAAECFWKPTGGKQPGDRPHVFLPFFQPHCPATEGRWHVPTMYGSAACRVAAAKSKQAQAGGERAECAQRPQWLTPGPACHPGRVLPNQKPEIPNSKALKSDQISYNFMDFSKFPHEVRSKRWSHTHLWTHIRFPGVRFWQQWSARLICSATLRQMIQSCYSIKSSPLIFTQHSKRKFEITAGLLLLFSIGLFFSMPSSGSYISSIPPLFHNNTGDSSHQ